VGPYPVHVPLSVDSMAALSMMAASSWSGVEAKGGTERLTRIDMVRVMGDTQFGIQGTAVDLLPKLEAFGIAVDVLGASTDKRVRWTTVPAREVAEAAPFFERRHHLWVAGRRWPVPEWARDTMSDLVIEDTLVIKGVDDQQLLVSADQGLPCTLVIATDWSQLDMRDIEIAYLRAIT